MVGNNRRLGIGRIRSYIGNVAKVIRKLIKPVIGLHRPLKHVIGKSLLALQFCAIIS